MNGVKTRTMEPRGGREGHGRHDLNETLKHRWGGSVKGEKKIGRGATAESVGADRWER